MLLWLSGQRGPCLSHVLQQDLADYLLNVLGERNIAQMVLQLSLTLGNLRALYTTFSV